MNPTTRQRNLGWGSRLLGIGVLITLGVGLLLGGNQQSVHASTSWWLKAESQYPAIVGTTLDNCSLCHTSAPSLNPYGMDFAKYAHDFSAIENLDSDKDGYTNVVEIRALTFPGDSASFPAPSATSTPTKAPPTATRTRTPIPPTATPTKIPPTPTRTQTPLPPSATPTNVPPTATRPPTSVPPSATPTKVLPTQTPTQDPPTATTTPTRTSTRVPPTATATKAPPTRTPMRPAPTATRSPAPKTQVSFRGRIDGLPGTRGRIGDWSISHRTVRVTSQTRISFDDNARIKIGATAVVRGTRMPDGSITANTIRILEDDEKGEHDD